MQRRRRVRLVAVGLALAVGASPILTDAGIAVLKPLGWVEGRCRVLRVVDGDTVELSCSGIGVQRARLQGFDTPELFSPGCNAERRAALAAKWALRGILLSAEVLRVRFDGEDRYGRRLAQVWVDGRPLSAIMVERGHARAYDGGGRMGWCDAA